ncbi:MAG: universal stress protein [Methanotrichaceae archaeon]|nr:universal stress protein [Methanotrichaceae archaeon]
MYQKILIAIDGSGPSARAARLGIDLAKLSGAKVTAIYVVDVLRLSHMPGYAAMPGIKDSILDLMLAEAEKATGEIEEAARELGLSCDRLVARGDPAEEIIRASEGMDLLVIGNVGRTGLAKFLLGSVAEKVVRNSRAPVLLVPSVA